MPQSFEHGERKVIPRWRKFSTTQQSGELQPINKSVKKSSPALNDSGFAAKLAEWKQDPQLFIATDLIGAALVLQREKDVHEAARFVMEHEHVSFAAKSLAQRILGISTSNVVADDKPRDLVKALRAKTRDTIYSDSPFVWTDLARAYEILGGHEKAVSAMKVALQLAPSNRFILRSAAHLFLHLRENELAHRVVRKSPIIEHDPWVMAAEIAIADKLGKTSQFVRKGRDIVEDHSLPDFHLSELASAVGTVEMNSGGHKRGLKLVKQSLNSPTENAIAQASWIERHLKLDLEQEQKFSLSAEASAFEAFQKGEWSNVLNYADAWWMDQPFSVHPVLLASYSAALIEDYERSYEICKRGMVSNSDDFLVLNNSAFALAKMGKVEEAQAFIQKAMSDDLNKRQRLIWLATDGLVKFRMGLLEQARLQYMMAMAQFKKDEDERTYAAAYLNLAFEEVRINPKKLSEVREEVERLKKLPYPDLQTMCEKVLTLPQMI